MINSSHNFIHLLTKLKKKNTTFITIYTNFTPSKYRKQVDVSTFFFNNNCIVTSPTDVLTFKYKIKRKLTFKKKFIKNLRWYQL